MTQDRRKDDKLPEGPLVFTDRNLTAAGLAHLEAERAAACLVHAGGDVWVGVGTKDALRGLLREDTASHSQAVPSELASLKSYKSIVGEECYRAADVQSLFSHSAATGKVPEDFVLMPKRLTAENGAKSLFIGEFYESTRVSCHECDGSGEDSEFDAGCTECGGEGTIEQKVAVEWDTIKRIYALAVEHLASPAAPLAGKAEPDAAQVEWSVELQKRLMAASEDDDNDSVRNLLAEAACLLSALTNRAPLAAAVPAEEAKPAATLLESHINHTASFLYAPAEPAPIQVSAELPETEILGALEAITHEVPKRLPPGWLKFAREIEKRVLSRLSKPTAQGTAQSIDTPEFSQVLARFCVANEQLEEATGREVFEAVDNLSAARAALIAHINRHIAAQAPAGRDAVLEEAARHFEQDVFDQDKVRMVVSEIRALKSHAAEQTSGGAK